MAGDLYLRGARLIDGTGADPVDDAVLVAGDGLVAYAGPASQAPPPSDDAHVIDAEGRALLPGLIDCHVHLCFDGEPDFEAEARAPSGRAALKATRNALRALNAGITTVRDLGGVDDAALDVAWASRAGIIQGPRILSAGRVLTITGGHGHYFGFEVDSAEELVKGVRALVKRGAGAIKLMATGGVLTSGITAQRSTFTVEQIQVAVAEAHEAGLRVAAHAIGADGIVAALRGGVDSVEHGCYLTDEALKLLDENPSWLVPTLVAPHQICFGGEGVPDHAKRKSEEVIAEHRESFRRAVEAGARIATGTDAGTPFNHHGGLSMELRLMHEAGMPLEQLPVAATAEAARLLGFGDRLGTLEQGKIADFVLLDGDPLTDVSAYEQRKVVLVAQTGRVVVGRLE